MLKITIEKKGPSINKIEEKEFDTKKEAKKFIKEMMKKYNLIIHTGHIVNYSNHLELWTNF